MTAKARTVVLVDDHEMARRGLAAMLSTAGWLRIVGEAGSCAEGVEVVGRLRPDVVLLDIRMGDHDGIACLEKIKALDRAIAVIMVTLYDDRQYVLEAIRRGASGYVTKDASTTDVISTIEAVAAGQLAIDPALLREALSAPDGGWAGATGRDRAEAYSITPRELDVVALIAEGLTNKEIGARLTISEDTVKKHVQNIIWKLRAADRTQAAIVALRLGLIAHAD